MPRAMHSNNPSLDRQSLRRAGCLAPRRVRSLAVCAEAPVRLLTKPPDGSIGEPRHCRRRQRLLPNAQQPATQPAMLTMLMTSPTTKLRGR